MNVAVAVGVGVNVAVAVAVGVGVDVAVAVGVTVGVGVGLPFALNAAVTPPQKLTPGVPPTVKVFVKVNEICNVLGL